jgi:chemosensory pili system protein ChpC
MSGVTDIAKSGNTGMTATQRKQFETVHSLLLPLNKELLLLPNAAVAEVIAYSEPEQLNGAPDWLLGMMSWRERRIPLISFESISDGEPGRSHKNCRIAILNTLNGNDRVPYIAVLMQGLPSLQVVRPNSIQYTDKPSAPRQSIKAYVNLNGVAALIPDLDELEKRIQNIH